MIRMIIRIRWVGHVAWLWGEGEHVHIIGGKDRREKTKTAGWIILRWILER
jgi:hypothetical protein